MRCVLLFLKKITVNDKKRNFYKYKAIESFDNSESMMVAKPDDLFVFLNARVQTISYDYHVDEMTKRLNKLYEFTSFVVFYPDITKTLQDGGLSDITGSAIPKKYVQVKQFTGKITGIFKKENDEN